jgi:uncharacterized coiled-coil protein SlyX
MARDGDEDRGAAQKEITAELAEVLKDAKMVIEKGRDRSRLL